MAQSGPFEQGLAQVGSDAIPWLIKGLEEQASASYKLKARVWQLLPKELRSKWRSRAPIHPDTLRINCVRALEMFGPEAVVATPRLIEVARSDPHIFAQAVAFNALAHMASDSAEAKAFLLRSLRDGDGALKTKVAGAFYNANCTPPEAVPLLVARLKNYVPPDQHSQMPLNEMLALSVCRPEEAAPAAPILVQYITHGGPGNAISALRATGPGALPALPRLFEVLEADNEWSTKLEPAVSAILARLGTNGIAALPVLTNCLSDPNPVVCALAAAGIANITGNVEFAVPRLVELLEKRRSPADGAHLSLIRPFLSVGLNHRQVSAMLLGDLGPGATNALPNLKRALNSSDLWLPVFAAEAIWMISKDTNAVLAALVAGLKHPDSNRRMLTLSALGKVGPPAAPAIPAMREAMQSELKVRRYGYVALQKIEGQAPRVQNDGVSPLKL